MVAEDPLAGGVIGVGVLVVGPDVVGREGPVVVHVRLPVRHRAVEVERVEDAGLDVPPQELVAPRVVALGPRDGQAVGGGVGEGHAEVVGLHAAVAGSLLAGPAVVEPGEEAAPRVAGHDVGVDPDLELVAGRVPRLDAVQRLAVDGVRLAADVVRDPGLRHQVALVGRVDEDAPGVRAAALHADRARSRPSPSRRRPRGRASRRTARRSRPPRPSRAGSPRRRRARRPTSSRRPCARRRGPAGRGPGCRWPSASRTPPASRGPRPRAARSGRRCARRSGGRARRSRPCCRCRCCRGRPR